ncbi:hypothetical protein BDW74DRAFT_6079 [Aspergillus multicolor]|uniref:uncharacterized protein n=1 Tax=Aspergillus multicolor TaxID=41759 RepID=UPI003CCD9461
MAVRRSARLRSLQSPAQDSPEPIENTANNNKPQNKLDSVMEREEPFDAPAKTHSTPAKAAHTPKTKSDKSPAKTPTTSITRPTHFEMHPSKVHQSTTKQADSGLILGFNPIKKDAQGNVVKEDPAQNTPSKVNASPASTYYGTPAFEFKFSCHDSELSDEAKKLMESVREDVARIKADLVKENAAKAVAESSQNGERKIAKPKGKSSRFSDAHMAQFKKMDSIAGHASAFRATPGRFQPVQKTLKRTNSKAHLDEPESQPSPAKTTPKTSTPSTPSAKRVKQDKAEATPQSLVPKSAISRPRSSIRSSLFTPTRTSLARVSGSLKPPRTSMIPSLARSPVSKPADAPTTPRTEFNPRFKSNIPTLSSLKSILRRHEPLFSKNPSKIAAGTHQTAPDFKPELLLQPSVESSPVATLTPSPKKRVGFTPCTKPRVAEEVMSPSPSKKPATITYPSTPDVVYPTLPELSPERSVQTPTTIRSVRPSDVPVEATLPEVSGIPHGLSHKKRHRATEDETDRENVPPADDAQERSVKRVKMNTPRSSKVHESSPLKPRSHTPSRLGSGAIRKGTPASARARSRVLSMSRLNLLAQPKNRS